MSNYCSIVTLQLILCWLLKAYVTIDTGVIMIAITVIATLVILFFAMYSGYYIWQAYNKPQTINDIFLDSIPGIFTTLGILGTFVGIFIALMNFDVNNITTSIPYLLGGLKTAFLTSILGIIFSLISSRFIENIQHTRKNQLYVDDELSVLKELLKLFADFKEHHTTKLDELITNIHGDNDNSIATYLIKLRTSLHDNFDEQNKILESIHKNVGADTETSLLTQISKMRMEQSDFIKNTNDHVQSFKNLLLESREFIGSKFEEFGKLLEKSNTEALVKAIENVIGGFNERLNELLQRLVKENFEELNQSVERLNQWQHENKEQVQTLINQFKTISSELGITSGNLEKISQYTKELIDGEGKLKALIQELEAVLTKNTMLVDSAKHLLQATEKMDKSAITLQNWMDMEKDLGQSIAKLIDNLKEIENLRDTSGQFWADIKERMNETINFIEKGNMELLKKFEESDRYFYERLNKSFENLDAVLQSMVTEYAERLDSILNPEGNNLYTE